MLAKLSEVTKWLGITDAAEEELVSGLLTALSDRVNGDCDRRIEREVSAVEMFDGGANHITLPVYPIESVTSVKESSTEDWAGTESLVEKSDFHVKKTSGMILRAGDMRFLSGVNSTQVIWTGGYVDPATAPLPAGAQYVPARLQNAIITQIRYLWKRRGELGLTSVGQGGGSWEIASKEPWLPDVWDVIKKFKRW